MTRIERARHLIFARSGNLAIILIASAALLISYLLIGKQIWLAKWGLVDDHELFEFMGASQRLPLSEVFSTLLDKTEVGSMRVRFRPSYYLLRLLETAAWGRNVQLWYLSHTVMFAFFLSATWWVMFKRIGIIASTLCIVPIICMDFWGGVWGRLGPAEIYATFATGFLLIGLQEMLAAPSLLRRNIGCSLITAGTVIIVGTKETLLPVSIFSVLMILAANHDRKIDSRLSAVCVTVVIFVAATIAGIVLYQLNMTGKDVYSNSVAPIERIANTWNSLHLYSAYFITLALICSTLLAIASFWISPYPASDRLKITASFFFIAGLFIVQVISYAGALPSGMRYDFPAMLLPIAFAVLLVCFVSDIAQRTGRNVLSNIIAIACAILIFSAYWPFSGLPGLKRTLSHIDDNIRSTSIFSTELQRVLQVASAHPDAPIFLDANDPVAYEPVHSLERYFRAANLRNMIIVRIRPAERSYGPLYDELYGDLQRLQNDGSKPNSPYKFSPLKSAPKTGTCLSVGLGGEPDSECMTFRIDT